MSNDAPQLSGNWSYPTAVRFGVGRIKEIGKVCKEQGMSRPLLVTDPGLANLPMIPAALSELDATTWGTLAAAVSEVASAAAQGNRAWLQLLDTLAK
mgnify:CR=1 FL=1